jgi:ParB/RepB/Spo0J family partition protein
VASTIEGKRSDLYSVDPFSIVINEELRGRVKAPNDQAIMELARSFKEHGQIAPVEVRRAGKELLVNSGFTRTMAARLLVKGFTLDGTEYQDEKFLLKVLVSNNNGEQAFLRNIVENSVRNQTSPIDDAVNQERLRRDYAYSDADIARLYGWPAPKVSNLKKLLQLSSQHQGLVHDGGLSVAAALDLLALGEEAREEVLQAALRTNEKINGAKIADAVRRRIIADASTDERDDNGEEAEPQVRVKARSVREIKTLLEEQAEALGPKTPGGLVCTQLMRWITGDLATERQVVKALEELG